MKLSSFAAERNKGPILDVLRLVLPEQGVVLEIASGAGQHVAHYAGALPKLTFLPSDPSAEARQSIEAYRSELSLDNVRAPLDLDVTRPDWPRLLAGQSIDALVCANMIHIAPWPAAVGLFEGAGELLGAGAPLVLYGPFRFGGVFRAESNAAFDADLRRRNPDWGVRDVDDVRALAESTGFDLVETVDMPANNHVHVFSRVG